MKKVFFIKYVLDTGYEYLNDEALVIAEDEDLAIKSLKEAVSKIGYEYWVDKILSIEEFKSNVFTKQYGFRETTKG